METLHSVVLSFDFCHCIEREGFVFTSIDGPANVLDAIVIRCPEDSASSTPIKTYSNKTLEEHIKIINQYSLEKACVIADNLEFISKCPSLKYLQIIPSKMAPDNFDYSPLYKIPEIRYLNASTEYGTLWEPSHTTIDYSKIKGLKEVWIDGNGHININKLNELECLYISNTKLNDLKDMECCKTLKKLDLMKTGIRSLEGIEDFEKLQWVSLTYERRLSDISNIIKSAETLRLLSLVNCPNVNDFSSLEKLINLEHLWLYGKNKISSLKFLKKLSKLQNFMFSIEVENGDLTPCLNIPYVWCKKGRKHYNLKDKDLPKDNSVGGFELI